MKNVLPSLCLVALALCACGCYQTKRTYHNRGSSYERAQQREHGSVRSTGFSGREANRNRSGNVLASTRGEGAHSAREFAPPDNGIRVIVYPDGTFEAFHRKLRRGELVDEIQQLQEDAGYSRVVHIHAGTPSVRRAYLEEIRDHLVKNKIPRVIIVTAKNIKFDVREAPLIAD